MVNRIFGQSYFVFVRVGLLRVVVVGVSCCLAIGVEEVRGSGVGLYERNNQPSGHCCKHLDTAQLHNSQPLGATEFAQAVQEDTVPVQQHSATINRRGPNFYP